MAKSQRFSPHTTARDMSRANDARGADDADDARARRRASDGGWARGGFEERRDDDERERCARGHASVGRGGGRRG